MEIQEIRGFDRTATIYIYRSISLQTLDRPKHSLKMRSIKVIVTDCEYTLKRIVLMTNN